MQQHHQRDELKRLANRAASPFGAVGLGDQATHVADFVRDIRIREQNEIGK